MTSPVEVLESIMVFNNKGLFSNHYLLNLVHNTPEWAIDESSLWEVYAYIKAIFEKKERNFSRYSESELEHHLIRPVLDKLGHHYGVQDSLRGELLKPDYAFFPSKTILDEAYTHKKDSEGFYRSAIAVGDAKAWDIPLDKSRRGAVQREMANPSFQIDLYLRATPPKWAILSNGRLWRLYHEDSSYKLDCYYEIDLPKLMKFIEETDDISTFKYFYLFFRLEAFPQFPLGLSFLDRVREESIEYAKKIGKDLKENVYRAMKVLVEGFLAEPSNYLSFSEEVMKEVQDNSLRLLYRLLFIFYAESRKLLDVDNSYYKVLSLRKKRAEIANKRDHGEKLLSVDFTYWDGLNNLCQLINDGSEFRNIPKEDFYIPPYDGGLFDPERNTFLRQKKVGDFYLAEAIDLLARSQDESGKKFFVDYSSLGIKHLGSIYEGILEYRVRVADEPMVAIKENKREVWIPEREAGQRVALDRIDAGKIYLATDGGERKVTGSYYTGDYVTKYMVANTLEPLMKKKEEECLWSGESYLKALLSIKVLDPAMGSGHFLVEATDQIAKELIRARETAKLEDGHGDIAEHDIQWARREVVRNCIYGVDLNPMAVELAKLSLWLTTVASNKPLNFLDHHLGCGNSLIGAKLAELTILPEVENIAEQSKIWKYVIKQHTDNLIKNYGELSKISDDDIKIVRWKEARYSEIKGSELNRRLNELANIWLSTYFENDVPEDDYIELQNFINPEKYPDWSGFREKEWFKRAQQIALQQRFFHWELEFPELFFEDGKRKENPGVDLVIGNPPYLDSENMTRRFSEVREVISRRFTKSAQGNWDLYIPFWELALSSIKIDGKAALITPNKWICIDYGEALRNLSKSHLYLASDFTRVKVFEDADVFPVVAFMDNMHHNVLKSEVYDEKYSLILEQDLPTEVLENTRTWGIMFSRYSLLLNKIQKISSNLSLNYEVGEAFTVSEAYKIVELLHEMEPTEADCFKFIITGTIDRYTSLWGVESTKYVKKPYRKPVVNKENLQAFSERRYMQASSEKIILSGIRHFEAFFDENGEYLAGKSTTLIRNKEGKNYRIEGLLPILNSDLMTFFIREVYGCLAMDGGINFRAPLVSNLPVRRISFGTPHKKRANYFAAMKTHYEESNFGEILKFVNIFLPKDEQGNLITKGENSDVLYDFLAFLAVGMTKMNKEKQAEIENFLCWLEIELGTRIEDLTQKTKIRSYYEMNAVGFVTILKKNQKKLAIDLARKKQKDIEEEFNRSVALIKPLNTKIKDTDQLINRIVCLLYGLTEEESDIVMR